MTQVDSLPPKLAEFVADFELMEGREKLELLLEYANRFPPFPAHLALPGSIEDVPECMTPVQMLAVKQGEKFVFHFDVPAESPTVRGYACLVMEGVNGCSREEILAIPADFYLRMGLQDVLTPQRLNGMAAILAHVKRSVVSK